MIAWAVWGFACVAGVILSIVGIGFTALSAVNSGSATGAATSFGVFGFICIAAMGLISLLWAGLYVWYLMIIQKVRRAMTHGPVGLTPTNATLGQPAMSDTITCPSCQRTCGVPETLLGQLVKCPTCQQTFTACAGRRRQRCRRVTRRPRRRPRPRLGQREAGPRRGRAAPPGAARRRGRLRRSAAAAPAALPAGPPRTPILTLGILSFFVGGPILGLIAWIMASTI